MTKLGYSLIGLFSGLSSLCFPSLEAWLNSSGYFEHIHQTAQNKLRRCSCQNLWAILSQCWSLFFSKGLLKCLYFGSTGKAPPNLPQGVPPLLHNQYIVGPGGLLPAYPVSSFIVCLWFLSPWLKWALQTCYCLCQGISGGTCCTWNSRSKC